MGYQGVMVTIITQWYFSQNYCAQPSTMARTKQKSREDNCTDCQQPTGVENNGIIAGHRYNKSMLAEWMAASVNN